VTQSIESLLAEAISVAERAGALTLSYFGSSDMRVESKHDGTEVTDADRNAESLIRSHIQHHHRHDTIFGEEHGTVEGTSGRSWIIDPIDGTFGFVRGVPLYATLLAVVDPEGPLLGVIHLPALGRTISAAREVGCWDGQTKCRVGDHDSVEGSLICASDWNAASEAQLISLHRSGAHMRTWGDAYGYAMVACGEAEAMIDPVCSPWDLAPIPVIVAEAGGRFSTVDGRVGFDHGNGVATNGLIHDELLTLLTPQSADTGLTQS